MMIALAKEIQALHEAKQSFVLVSLIQIKGSAPQIEGAKMLVTAKGLHWGTVGGGKIEAHCIRHAQACLNEKRASEAQTWNLQTDIGMSCGGAVTMFFDVQIAQDWNIALFGAGHIVQELARILQGWPCQLSIFDPRAEWIERLPRSSNLEKKLTARMEDEVAALPKGTFLLSITQGHGTDLPVLREALKRPDDFAIIGVIGSEVKAAKLKRELAESGTPGPATERLVCPLGLPVGNNTPQEIAISVAAQVLAVRDKKSFAVKDGFCSWE